MNRLAARGLGRQENVRDCPRFSSMKRQERTKEDKRAKESLENKGEMKGKAKLADKRGQKETIDEPLS
jgi:hypothetical protein